MNNKIYSHTDNFLVTFEIVFFLFWASYFEWFYGGADFERQISPAHRSAQVGFRPAPLRFPLTCSGYDCKELRQ